MASITDTLKGLVLGAGIAVGGTLIALGSTGMEQSTAQLFGGLIDALGSAG